MDRFAVHLHVDLPGTQDRQVEKAASNGILRDWIKPAFAKSVALLHVIDTTVDGLNDEAAWYISGPYSITVGEPISFSGDPNDRARGRAVTDEVMQHITSLSAESARSLRVVQAQAARSVQPIETSLAFRLMRFLLNPV